MTEKNSGKPRRIRLVCEHDLWLAPPLPSLAEELWCSRCQEYREVGPAKARTQRMYLEEWMSEPVRLSPRVMGFKGTCCDCPYYSTDRNWYALRETMESHYVAMHATGMLASIVATMREVERPDYKKLTAPPF